jgi:hypothetical protein
MKIVLYVTLCLLIANLFYQWAFAQPHDYLRAIERTWFQFAALIIYYFHRKILEGKK